jgi:hypothetical protein
MKIKMRYAECVFDARCPQPLAEDKTALLGHLPTFSTTLDWLNENMTTFVDTLENTVDSAAPSQTAYETALEFKNYVDANLKELGSRVRSKAADLNSAATLSMQGRAPRSAAMSNISFRNQDNPSMLLQQFNDRSAPLTSAVNDCYDLLRDMHGLADEYIDKTNPTRPAPGRSTSSAGSRPVAN